MHGPATTVAGGTQSGLAAFAISADVDRGHVFLFDAVPPAACRNAACVGGGKECSATATVNVRGVGCWVLVDFINA